MFTKEILLLIQDFLDKCPGITEDTQDFAHAVVWALLEAKEEGKLSLLRMKEIAMTQIERGTNYKGEIMISPEEKVALKGLIYKLVYLKEEEK